MKRRPLSLSRVSYLSSSAQLILPENVTSEQRQNFDLSPTTEIVEELIKTKAEVDKIIRCLLRSFDVKNNGAFPGDFTESFVSTVKRDLKPKNLETRAHSWPPVGVSSPLSASETIYTRVEQVAFRILQTSVIALLDTDIATTLMKELQTQMEFQKNLNGQNLEANELLTKLLYIFAPLLRITESFVQTCFDLTIRRNMIKGMPLRLIVKLNQVVKI
jgi:hypothetical protein